MRRSSVLLLALLAGRLFAAGGVAPAATATGKTFPVALALSVSRTALRVNQKLGIRIELQNIGDKLIVVVDDLFVDPDRMRDNAASGVGTYVQVQGPDGKHLSFEPLDVNDEWEERRPSPEERAASDRQYSEWKAQGLSLAEINRRFLTWKSPAPKPKPPSIKLAPSATAAFPSTTSASGYAPLTDFAFHQPGKYRIRAIYDRTMNPREKERIERKHPNAFYGFTRVETDWIDIVVLK